MYDDENDGCGGGSGCRILLVAVIAGILFWAGLLYVGYTYLHDQWRLV